MRRFRQLAVRDAPARPIFFLGKRVSLIHNERTKLSATYLNGVAIAVLAVGGLGPLITRPSALPPSVWFASAAARHYISLRVAFSEP
ncbi:MAG TPA: hypothetical protein VLA00_11990 [Xanthobacteraceae bacterium]|nr:hypothetical protein [Xanthobacteraceae bacterium]